MFFIPRIVFVSNAQNIYVIVAEWKNPFLELIHFYMKIKKNYVSLKKNERWKLWDGTCEMETAVQYLSIKR